MFSLVSPESAFALAYAWDIPWPLVSVLTNVIVAIAVVWTVFIYRGQLKTYKKQLEAMTKSHQLESTLQALKYVDNIQLRRARWFVYEHIELLNGLIRNKTFEWNDWHHIDHMV
jgi:hypothetical protein